MGDFITQTFDMLYIVYVCGGWVCHSVMACAYYFYGMGPGITHRGA